MHRLVLTTAAIAALAVAARPAQAFPPEALMPASDARLGDFTWEGVTGGPRNGFTSLTYSGPGSGRTKGASGTTPGLGFGYDWQVGSMVVGADASVAYAGLTSHRATASGDIRTRLDYQGALRARAGYAFGRFLLYGTAGWSFSELEVADRRRGGKDRSPMNGWIAGVGLEWRFNRIAVLRGEVTRSEYGERSFSSLPAGYRSLGAAETQFRLDMVFRF